MADGAEEVGYGDEMHPPRLADGNGRTSCFMMDYVLTNLGLPAPIPKDVELSKQVITVSRDVRMYHYMPRGNWNPDTPRTQQQLQQFIHSRAPQGVDDTHLDHSQTQSSLRPPGAQKMPSNTSSAAAKAPRSTSDGFTR